jgi:hypothetical protein
MGYLLQNRPHFFLRLQPQSSSHKRSIIIQQKSGNSTVPSEDSIFLRMQSSGTLVLCALWEVNSVTAKRHGYRYQSKFCFVAKSSHQIRHKSQAVMVRRVSARLRCLPLKDYSHSKLQGEGGEKCVACMQDQHVCFRALDYGVKPDLSNRTEHAVHGSREHQAAEVSTLAAIQQNFKLRGMRRMFMCASKAGHALFLLRILC